MVVRLGSNIASLTVQRHLGRATEELRSVSERLSSGQRINKASDDAAGLAIATSLRADTRIYSQGIRNLNDGISATAVAESAIESLGGIAERIQELATQAMNGSLSDKQRSSLQGEVSALQSEWNRIVESTTFNSLSVLRGNGATILLQGGKGLESSLSISTGERQFAGGLEGFAGTITRVNVSTQGQHGVGYSFSPSISGDGRYIAFNSNSGTLVANDTLFGNDAFVRDTLLGITTLVSTSSAGVQANSFTGQVEISADGKSVAFESLATNLVAGDSNGVYDIYVKSLTDGTLVRASTTTTGVGATGGASTNPSLSADGKMVVFTSSATNLATGDSNGVGDIFVKNLFTGELTLVSANSSGTIGNGASDFASISADGRYVSFTSSATNLVSGDTNGVDDVFRKDLQTGEIIRVSTSATGVQGNSTSSTSSSSISADGRYVAFISTSSNFTSTDSNPSADAFVKDLVTGEITNVHNNADGVQGIGAVAEVNISADGRFVAIESSAANMDTGDSNGTFDIFRKDRQSGTLTRVSVSTSGAISNGYNRRSSMSADGRYIAFDTLATNLISASTNGPQDVFVRDLTRVGVQQLAGMVVSNRASAGITLEMIKSYRDELLEYRTGLGASTSRITAFLSTLSSKTINYQAAESRISDADVAQDAAVAIAAEIRQQVAASLLAQANQAPRIGLSLLQNA